MHPPFKSYALLLITLLVVCGVFAAVDLQSVSQTASVTFKQTSGLDTLSASDDSHQIELRTQLGRGFVLDLKHHDSPVLSPNYEEIVHDVSKQSSPNQPHLTIIRSSRDNINNSELSSLQQCLYQGKVVGDDKSVVALNTCTGELTGLIELGTGELFSIEPVNRLNGDDASAASSKGGISAQSLSNLRTLALQGDLRALSNSIPEVLLVDVHAEARLEDLEREQSQQQPQQVNNRLNVEDIDAPIAPGSTCASEAAVHHPPHHILRKAGLSDDDIHKIIENPSSIDDTASEQDGGNSDFETLANYKYPIRYVEVLLYHDYARLRRFNTTRGLTQDDLIAASRADAVSLFNNIRTYYLASNFKHKINMVLLGHVFFAGGDPYTKYLARDGGTMVISNNGLLENFNKYRAAYGHSNHDMGVLLSGNRFQSNIMGVANIGSICGGTRYNGNINSITYRNLVKSSVLTAHECGHILSAQHDNYSGYIMYPYVSSDTRFSPQSVRSVDYYLSRTRCTINNPQTAMDDRNTNRATTQGILSILSQNKTPRSTIYTENILDNDRFDAINPALIQDGILFSADYHLPTDEVISSSAQGPQPLLTPKSQDTTPLSLRNLLLSIGLTALLTCGLTTAAIVFILRYLLQNKDLQSVLTGQKELTKASPTALSQPGDNNNNRFDFTPRLRQKQEQTQAPSSPFDSTLPNTPRVVPSSPSYSETVRHRHAQQAEDDNVDNTSGIIFEGEYNAKQQQQPLSNKNDVPIEDLRTSL